MITVRTVDGNTGYFVNSNAMPDRDSLVVMPLDGDVSHITFNMKNVIFWSTSVVSKERIDAEIKEAERE
ncbi:hypothetical protein ACFU44_00690 [Nocardia rhizosphaerihabitans]|uniref:hypothetical protein n=1 Tax=Nocardia rhizosphaerihabitans TaxID=1691570 RepID=UPI00366B3CDC